MVVDTLAAKTALSADEVTAQNHRNSIIYLSKKWISQGLFTIRRSNLVLARSSGVFRAAKMFEFLLTVKNGSDLVILNLSENSKLKEEKIAP